MVDKVIEIWKLMWMVFIGFGCVFLVEFGHLSISCWDFVDKSWGNRTL